MRVFFEDWRRKAGVVTLVIACMFAVGWVRSLTETDGIASLPLNRAHYLVSQNSKILWFAADADFYGDEPEHYWLRFQAGPADFQVNARQPDFRLWVIPYWSVLVPVALLSAYLLLSPRPEPKKTL